MEIRPKPPFRSVGSKPHPVSLTRSRTWSIAVRLRQTRWAPLCRAALVTACRRSALGLLRWPRSAGHCRRSRIPPRDGTFAETSPPPPPRPHRGPARQARPGRRLPTWTPAALVQQRAGSGPVSRHQCFAELETEVPGQVGQSWASRRAGHGDPAASLGHVLPSAHSEVKIFSWSRRGRTLCAKEDRRKRFSSARPTRNPAPDTERVDQRRRPAPRPAEVSPEGTRHSSCRATAEVAPDL